MTKQFAALLLCGTFASACSTTNFAPPVVNLTNGLNANSSRVCTPAESEHRITNPTVNNARALIRNFVLVYRCRSREAANGRQFFQLPAFFSVVGAAAASAFGAGPDVGIAAGVASSIFNAGNSYYSPQRQAEIYDSALDALTCVQTEAVGIDAFNGAPASNAANAADEDGGDTEGSFVHTSAAAQYYDMILGALFQVERVTAARLRNVGTFDPAGVVAEITALNQEVATRTTAAEDAANNANVADEAAGSTEDEAETVRLQLQLLQPKLQRCILRAKI